MPQNVIALIEHVQELESTVQQMRYENEQLLQGIDQCMHRMEKMMLDKLSSERTETKVDS
jgi:hypothetical protein